MDRPRLQERQGLGQKKSNNVVASTRSALLLTLLLASRPSDAAVGTARGIKLFVCLLCSFPNCPSSTSARAAFVPALSFPSSSFALRWNNVQVEGLSPLDGHRKKCWTMPRPSRGLVAACSPDAGSDKDETVEDGEVRTKYLQEETLLCMRFNLQRGGNDEQRATEALQTFTQTFPFAAVLPVQPLMYLPTADGGVEIKFMRKKTTEKPGIDGGIRFFIKKIPRVGDEASSAAANMTLEVTAKRNSVGQSIPKMFAEKLVITAFVEALTQPEKEQAYGTPQEAIRHQRPPPTCDYLAVKSIYHKWM